MLTYTLTITLTCNIYRLLSININICMLILTLIKLINNINGLISCLVSYLVLARLEGEGGVLHLLQDLNQDL